MGRDFKDRRYEMAIARWLERELGMREGTILAVRGVEYYPGSPGYGTYTPGEPAAWSLYYTTLEQGECYYETSDDELVVRMVTEACEFLA